MEYEATDGKTGKARSLGENSSMGQNTNLRISKRVEKKEQLSWKSKEVSEAIMLSSSSKEGEI